MANYKTGAQRYNDRMDKIWEQAKLQHKTIHNPNLCENSVPCYDCEQITNTYICSEGHTHQGINNNGDYCVDNIPL